MALVITDNDSSELKHNEACGAIHSNIVIYLYSVEAFETQHTAKSDDLRLALAKPAQTT